MVLVSDAELSKALADPFFRDLDLEDREIAGIIKIIDNVCGAVTDGRPFSELLLGEDYRVCTGGQKELLLN